MSIIRGEFLSASFIIERKAGKNFLYSFSRSTKRIMIPFFARVITGIYLNMTENVFPLSLSFIRITHHLNNVRFSFDLGLQELSGGESLSPQDL